jgi:hypothetical protein
MNRSLHNSFIRSWTILASLVFCISIFAVDTFAQQASTNTPQKSKLTVREDRDDETPPSVTEMVEKQRILRQKKEHGEMLKRGDEALRLSEELEASFNDGASFTPQEMQKLEALEKVVGKIRNELGGDDDDDSKLEDSTGAENNARRDVVSAFKFLRNSTIKLVDELKKSSRFSISVGAVESSNAVIRIARFLRLKK